jgi:DNA-binding winged helix-turn-helix (wHTH) protein
MQDAIQSQGRMRFGAFDVNLRTGELCKHGRKIRLAGRPFQILALLLEQPGELVTRKDLQEKLWPADTFVDFEHGVNAAVRTLRLALCDSHKKPRFVETLPRRGYRFIAAVEKLERVSPVMVPESPQSPTPSLPISELAGKVATVCDPQGRNFVLVPVSEEVLDELCTCENANDDLGVGLLLSAEKLLLVDCGTEVKILDAQSPDRGCAVRIMAGQFYGAKAFIRRINLDVVL